MKTILCVDDNEAILGLLAALVESAQHTALQAPNGEAALEWMAADQNVDLLITDILMPGMNGFELARVFRDKKPELPILFISGYLDSLEDELRDWMREPKVHFLPKPFAPYRLMGSLDSLMAANAPREGLVRL